MWGNRTGNIGITSRAWGTVRLDLHMARNGLYTTDLNTSKQVGVKGEGTNGTNLFQNRYKQGTYHNIVNKTKVHKYWVLITTGLY